MSKFVFPGLLLGLALLLGGCSPGASQATPAVETPAGDWSVSTPGEQGVDAARLQALLEQVESQNIPLHSLLIVRHGVLIQESYFAGYKPDDLHEMFSVTKSFISTLVGIAIDDGKISGVGGRVVDLLPGYSFENLDGRKKAITLEDVLTMSSGLDWAESENDFSTLVQSSDWVRFMFDRPVLEEPGSRFLYCTGCSHILSGVLQTSLDGDVLEFAGQRLFAPLGITHYTWDTDAHDLPIGGWGLNLTPRDMARFGQLFLNEGRWGGEQVVSKSWVENATRGHIAAEEGWDYGYHWWVYPKLEAYAAIGRGGQTVVVLPALDMVVVTTAALPGSQPVFDLIEEYVLPAVNP